MNIWEEYKVTLERTTKLEDRRQGVTATYLTVNSLICGTIAFLVKDSGLNGHREQVAVAAFLVSGIAATFLWRAILKQLSELISFWYSQARALEAKMPNSHSLVTSEFTTLDSASSGRRALGLTSYERALSWIFTAIYALFLSGGLAVVIFVPSGFGPKAVTVSTLKK